MKNLSSALSMKTLVYECMIKMAREINLIIFINHESTKEYLFKTHICDIRMIYSTKTSRFIDTYSYK